MTNAKATKSQRVSISKHKLADSAKEMETAASSAAAAGQAEALRGAERLDMAGEMMAAGATQLAKSASDLTKSQDEQLMSERMAVLSDVVGVAGVVDIAEGAELLAASEDVAVMSALVGMMSVDDLEHGMDLARLSGELNTARDIVEALHMPVLADFLSERSTRLHAMSVEQIRLAIATKGVSQILAGTGKQITALGANELEEGVVRLKLSEAASEQSAAMLHSSEELANQGLDEVVLAAQAAQSARVEARQGMAEISAGSAVVGAALAVDEVATTLKKKSE